MCLLHGKPVAGLGPQMQPDIPPYWTTYVSVSDVDATVKAVESAGGQVMMPSMDVLTAGRMAVFADPTGAPFSVWQPGDHIGSSYVNEPGSLSWNELATRNPDQAIVFYSEVFGWTADAQPMGEMAYTVWMLDGESIGGMMPMGDMFPPEVPPHWSVYFAVEDTDATVAKITSLGGSVVAPPMDIPQGRFAAVSDPHGAMFSVIALP
jgi:predicted enzyme related to lactoylglutathione lyase